MTSQRKILVVFPNQPVGVDGGAQLRCAQIVRGFMQLGCRVRLLHPGPSTGGLARLAEYGPDYDQRQIELTRLDDAVGGVRARLVGRVTGRPRLGRSAFYSPRVRRWFAGQVREFDPDVVWMIYLKGHHLLRPPATRHCLRVIDTLDLITKHQAIYRAACGVVGPEDAAVAGLAPAVPDADLREDYYDAPGFAPDPEEYRLIDTYDVAVAISPSEAGQISANARHARVACLPLTARAALGGGTHDGGPLAVLSYHPIILHCYLYFVRKVLPTVLRSLPGFRLRLVGSGSDRFPRTAGVEPAGFVPDIEHELDRAQFLVLPVFGMTGQQTRITVAMSRGVPVVTLRRAAESAGVRHMVNGMVADGADEFAAHVVYMCEYPHECRRMGLAAWRTIEESYSDRFLLSTLESVIAPRPPGRGG